MCIPFLLVSSYELSDFPKDLFALKVEDDKNKQSSWLRSRMDLGICSGPSFTDEETEAQGRGRGGGGAEP